MDEANTMTRATGAWAGWATGVTFSLWIRTGRALGVTDVVGACRWMHHLANRGKEKTGDEADKDDDGEAPGDHACGPFGVGVFVRAIKDLISSLEQS